MIETHYFANRPRIILLKNHIFECALKRGKSEVAARDVIRHSGVGCHGYQCYINKQLSVNIAAKIKNYKWCFVP